jgi:hypothetical protein
MTAALCEGGLIIIPSEDKNAHGNTLRQAAFLILLLHGAFIHAAGGACDPLTCHHVNGERGHGGLAIGVLGVDVDGRRGPDVAGHWVECIDTVGRHDQCADWLASQWVCERHVGASRVDLGAASNAEARQGGGGAGRNVGIGEHAGRDWCVHRRGHSVGRVRVHS